MLFISTISKYSNETSTRIVERIKNGDKQLKEKFTEDYIPLIIKVISGFYSEKIVDVKNSNEYSIGLMAFDEAIEKFDSRKNIRFLNFAQTVIKRRIVDYSRNISSIGDKEVLLSNYESKSEIESEEVDTSDIDEKSSRYELVKEIKEFSEELAVYGLNIRNLPDYMPKHKASKQICLNVAKEIIGNKDIYDRLLTNKALWTKELSEIIDIPSKIVERNSKFIICVCIIFGNNYENFKAYLNQVF
ncbi:MAG: sigma factor [Bacillota bacterium]|nr:sigma factor [Bacillota bacterium]